MFLTENLNFDKENNLELYLLKQLIKYDRYGNMVYI